MLGRFLKILTTCDAFKMTMNKSDLRTRITRWGLLLENFDDEIKHCSGKRTSHVDTLSKFSFMLITHSRLLFKCKSEQEKDKEVCGTKEILQSNPYRDYCLNGNLLYNFVDGFELLVAPTAVQTNIIKDSH